LYIGIPNSTDSGCDANSGQRIDSCVHKVRQQEWIDLSTGQRRRVNFLHGSVPLGTAADGYHPGPPIGAAFEDGVADNSAVAHRHRLWGYKPYILTARLEPGGLAHHKIV